MSILDAAQDEADRHGGARVEAIHIQVGPLSGIVSESLLSAYDLAREQTPFQDCRLVIEEIPVLVYCSKCQAQRTVVSMQSFCCAECGTPATEIVQGRELLVCALELAE
jgi:hydrogenase nickel incorporation protein HypA/HybF